MLFVLHLTFTMFLQPDRPHARFKGHLEKRQVFPLSSTKVVFFFFFPRWFSKHSPGCPKGLNQLFQVLAGFCHCLNLKTGFLCGSAGKESSCNAGNLGLIPGLGRSSGEGKGYQLQYSGLENSIDCAVHGVAKNRTRLSDFHLTSLQSHNISLTA